MVANIPGSLHGACTRRQALDALGTYGVRAAIDSGALVAMWPRVLVLGERQLELRTRAAAALLTAGPESALCGFTAAALHGCEAVPLREIDVIVPYNRWVRRRAGLRVRTGRMMPEDVCLLEGLRVQPLDLVVSELLCTARPRQVLSCADQAFRLQPPTARRLFGAAVQRRLRERPDRRGSCQATMLVELANGEAESPPESWLRLLLVEHRYPPPEVQHPVCDLDGNLVWRLDLAWPTLRIGLEYDGYEAHLGREDRDAMRDEDLRRRGWIIIHATAEDLRDPGRMLAELAAAFRHRGRGLSATA